MIAHEPEFEGTDPRRSRSRTASPLVLLPRELGQVPPPVAVVGGKARALSQLLTLKSRVPRFGIVVGDAFDQHVKTREVAAALDAATATTVVDDAMLIGLGERVTRAVLRVPLSPTLARGLDDLRRAFPDDDAFSVRASPIGDPAEIDALAGALEPALGVRDLPEAVQRLFALAYHPRTLQARRAAGLPPFQTRLALVVQRLVHAEQSGLCWSIDAGADVDDRRSQPRARVRACPGLAGGAGGVRGVPHVPCDVFLVERAVDAEQGLADDARVEARPARKLDALRVEAAPEKPGARLRPLEGAAVIAPSLSTVQARLVAREALRLEATFGRPQAMTFAFAGRLLHVLDVEPLRVPRGRIESGRQRTWDERLVPAPLSRQPSSTLTFSVWQRGIARGLERAGRLLGVRGVVLEDMRPQFRRLLGVVTGRITGNLEVLVALLELLPFADKAREAVAGALGQPEVGALPATPLPGFWQRARGKIEETRWPAQLERLSQVATGEGLRFADEVRALLAALAAVHVAQEDPDALQDRFDSLEEALGRCVAALTLAGMQAALYLADLRAVLAELGLDASVVAELVPDDDAVDAARDIDGDVVVGVRRLHSLVRLVDERPALRALFARDLEPGAIAAALAEDVEPAFAELRRGLAAHVAATAPEGVLTLEEPRLVERPERSVEHLLRLVRSSRPRGGRLEEARARRARAEAFVDTAIDRIGGMRAAALRKRRAVAVAGLQRHGAELQSYWVPTERVIASLRQVALALGERLFEHGLLDQPRDVFHLQDAEVAGVIRGTGPDVDVRPLVVARRRAAAARPATMARRVETHGVVATSLLLDDEPDRGARVADAGVVRGVAAVGGRAAATVCLLERADPALPSVRPIVGVAVVSTLSTGELPLAAVADAVVIERGAVLSPLAHALRQLAVPTVVDVPDATLRLEDGEAIVVEAGVVRRASAESSEASAAPTAQQTGAADAEAPVAAAVVVGALAAASATPGGAPSASAPATAAVALPVTQPDATSGEPSGGPPLRAPAGMLRRPLPRSAGKPGDGAPPPLPVSADGEPVAEEDVVDEEPVGR